MLGKTHYIFFMTFKNIFFFIIFSQKIGFDISLRDKLNEISKPVFWREKKKEKKNIISLIFY